MSAHPPIDSLARFAAGLLPGSEMVPVALHVVGCPRCRAATTHPTATTPRGGPSSAYAEAIGRVARRSAARASRHARQRRRAPALLSRVLGLPPEEWDRVIRSSPRLHSHAFACQALTEARAGWTDDPGRSERLARLALEVADRLGTAEHGRRNLEDLRSRAWAYIANCRRLRSAYSSVPDALQAAADHLGRGTGDERDRAELLRFTGSYLVDMGWDAEASEVSAEGHSVATELGDTHLEVEYLVLMSKARWTSGDRDGAFELVRKAARRLRPDRDPRLGLILATSLALFQSEMGHPRRALAAFRPPEPRQLASCGHMDLARFAWAESMIHRRLGDLDRAVELLAAGRQAFVDSPSPVIYACATLDLAYVHLDLGQSARAVALAAEAFPLFAFQALQREMLETLDLFRRAGGLD